MPAQTPPRKYIVQAAVILAVLLGLTGAVWRGVSDQAERLAQERFLALAGQVESELASRMQDYAQILRGAAGLMEARGGAARHEWHRYYQALDVEQHYPGIQGIGYAIRVPARFLSVHEAGVQAEGFPDYTVTPAGQRDEYYPIVFLEPFADRNLRAFGYDMYSNPVRQAAMAAARDENRAALTGKVKLVQEDGRDVQAGTLLYLPFYEPGADVSTVEARRDAIRGFAYSPFRMGDLVRGAVGHMLRDLDVRVLDVGGDEALLFGADEPPAAAFVHSQQVDVFGRPWLVEVRSTPHLENAIDSAVPEIVLGAGLIISVLAMWLCWALIAERAKREALAVANRDLAVARGEAEAAAQAKSRFLAAASHDIRQPVQSMVLLVGALKPQLDGQPGRRIIEHLDRSLDALRALLDSLLDVSRLDAGVVEARIQPTELAPILEALGREYAMRAAERGLSMSCESCRVRADTDPTLLERILRNLLENALRYTREGEVALVCTVHGRTARINVRDTGIGIPDDHLSRIFEEFHQVANSERDRTQGLGLGLAIVRRLAGMLGHQVDVASSVGRGSCFTVLVENAELLPDSAAEAMQRSA